ncbi:hypothetical protein ACP4OV_015072 [Aristida adscensionis]
MGILPDDYLTNVTKKGYLKDAEKKANPNQEVEKAEDSRLESYLRICMSGFVTVYWSDAATTLEEIRQSHATLVYTCHLCFLASAILMLIGAIAANFPSTTPCKMGFAGLGAWIAFIFALGTFHLQTFKAHLEPIHALLSMIVSSYFLTVFWGVCAQDPVVLHVIAKWTVWVISRPVDLLCYIVSELGKRLDMEAVVTCYTSLKEYLPSYPPFLPEDFLSANKGYLQGNQEDEQIKQNRLEKYFSLCLSGITTLYWGSAAGMIMQMHKTHAAVAYSCVMYSLIALLLIFVGVIAASFPSSTPCKMGFAGLGAWQALIFIVATYHLATFKLHLEPKYSIGTMCASSLILSILWAIAGQDPIDFLCFSNISYAAVVGVVTVFIGYFAISRVDGKKFARAWDSLHSLEETRLSKQLWSHGIHKQ